VLPLTRITTASPDARRWHICLIRIAAMPTEKAHRRSQAPDFGGVMTASFAVGL